jgi:beta-phosphoglucomutase-like phosphatase (HAD superfamily)/dTDP-glucose pyrophosphorylase
MIKNLIFDLDGVLFDGVEFHKNVFLKSLYEVISNVAITPDFHDQFLNGMSTKQKLTYLYQKNMITEEQKDIIETLKIKYTMEELSKVNFKKNSKKQLIKDLSRSGFKIYCVSNSIRQSCITILTQQEIIEYFYGIVSNEDVIEKKPSPYPYVFTFEKYGLNPSETLIFEDSYHGRCSAYETFAHVVPIVDPMDLTFEKIMYEVHQTQLPRHITTKLNVNIVVPMAGHGSRFSKVGYTIPKPFIPVFGKPMIEWVITNILPGNETYNSTMIPSNIVPHFHFIAQAEHLKHYDLGKICRSHEIDYTITTVDKVTEGPACTVLLTKEHINNDWPLITINSDQYLDWNINEFYKSLLNPTFDGCINTFIQPNEKDIKWSYAKLNENGLVSEVAEKNYISNLATTGVYGWKKGSDFVSCAEEMIQLNERVNNEFYVCPVYNYLIRRGGKVRVFQTKKLWGLGVPEDLTRFLECYQTM